MTSAQRAAIALKLREFHLSDEQIAEVDALLRLQERLPTLELLRVIDPAPSPAPRIYLARHRSAGGCEALATIAPWSDPAQLRRFQREARMASAVRHPLLAGLIDAGEQRGVCWVAVERVTGPTFAELLRGPEPLTETRLLTIIRAFAGGLSALASAGLLHRAVTPAAVRVAQDDDGRGAVARVVDAGLMRGLCGLRRQAELDCPDYLAPEQVRGQAIDERALVYSLGAILFHGLAGAPPFAGSSPEMVRKAHLFEPAPDLRRLIPDLRDETSRLIALALRKGPEERFRSLDEFAGACERALIALGALSAPAIEAVAPPEGVDPTPATSVVALQSGDGDPFEDADAASPDALRAEITSRILAKHAALKAARGGTESVTRKRPTVITQSFLAASAAVTRLEVVSGIILANRWLDDEGQRQLREFCRANASALPMRMRGGVSGMLVKRGIIDEQQAGELEATLADQVHFPQLRLGRCIGPGQLGRTYVAHDARGENEVALKVVRVADDDQRHRFLDEHASLARAMHPRVAQAIACGAEGEVCYASSRLIEGMSLASLLSGDRIAPEAWALRIAHQIAEALAYVHSRTGQAHLGLSPGNVLLARAPDETRLYPPGDRAMVSDFGLAALAPLRRANPAWTAPELLRGEGGDARSDMYSLGAMLHRMLTGRPPTSTESASGADPGRLAPGLHPLTREAVATALQADRAQRYADHDVLVAVLAQACRELVEIYAHEPQIVGGGGVETQQVSTRVLRRNGGSGPLPAAPQPSASPGPQSRSKRRRDG
jgi:serine/threonine protein kinase